MRRFVMLVFLCVLGVSTAVPVLAQDEGEGDGEQRSERRGSPFGGGGGDMVERIVGYLEDELALDEDQASRVRTIMDEGMTKVFKRMAEVWQPGQDAPDYRNMRTIMEDLRLEMEQQIEGVLTDAQKREFHQLSDDLDRRSQEWEQRARAWDDPTMMFEPAPLSKRILMAKAERSLFLGPDETRVVMPYVEAVLDRRIALSEGKKVRREDLANAFSGGASENEVRQRLNELRSVETLQSLELASAQTELRALITVQQEVRLVALGILD